VIHFVQLRTNHLDRKNLSTSPNILECFLLFG